MQAAIAFWDANLECRFANHAFGVWHDIDHRKIPGMTMVELVGEPFFALSKPMIDAVLRGERQEFERSRLCDDGVLRNVIATYLPWVVDDVTNGFVAYIVDISSLRLAEERAREIDAAYKYTIDLSGQIPWTASADGSLFSVSDAWEGSRHSSSERPRALTLQDYAADHVYPDDIEWVVRETIDRMAAGLHLDQRYRLRTPEGSYRWWRSRAAPRRDEHGAIVTWYGTLENVHDQVVEEEQRRERDIAYRLTIELSGKMPWTTSADGNIVFGQEVAGRWAALTGRPATETIAEYYSAIHPADFERIGLSRDAAILAGQPIDYRYRLRMADGNYRWWHSRASPLLDRHGVVRWYGTLEDVHDRVFEEDRVRRLENELVHLGRLAAMNSLASTLAHELNQPLAAITNYVNGARRLLALGDMAQVAAIDNALEAAANSAMRSAGIIRSLRAMVAKGTVNLRDESLASIIEDACLLTMPDATFNGAECDIRIAPGLTTIHIDHVQFKQVLINLLRNALDAVEARPVRRITIEARRQTGVVEISVSDTGLGVAPDQVDKLFEAFNSTKEDGLGIGLSLCRTIVEANGGNIGYASVPGGGACFTITIPDSCWTSRKRPNQPCAPLTLLPQPASRSRPLQPYSVFGQLVSEKATSFPGQRIQTNE